MVKNGLVMMQKMGIIGWPLGHTMSPVLHNFLFSSMNIAAEYAVWPTPLEKLSSFVARVREEKIQGVSVTIPHKIDIIPHLDGISKRGQSIGAINTLYWKDGLLLGENTDVDGLLFPLLSVGKSINRAVVLGAGGAARAAVAGLLELGVEHIYVSNRTAEKATLLAEDFSVATIPWGNAARCVPELVINTTPLGMAGELEQQIPWEEEFLPSCIFYDLVYNPMETRFLRAAREHGCQTLEGIHMFIHQGLAQFKLWTGREPDVEAATAVVRSALGGVQQ